MPLEELEKLKEYNEKQAKLLLSRLGLDYRPLLELFEEKNGVYTKVKNFAFVVKLLQLANENNIDPYLQKRKT